MAKGKDFEREIAVRFSLWLTEQKHDDYVWHTGSSGARGTVRKKNKKSADNTIIGDLAAANDSVKYFFDFFNVELKTGYPKSKRLSKKDSRIHVHNWSIGDMLDGTEKKPILLKFWDQAITDGDKSKREPILVFRRNHKKPCIAMANDIFETIRHHIRPPKRIISSILVKPRFYMPFVICGLSDFFSLTYNKMSPYIIECCSSILLYRDKILQYRDSN